MDSMSLDFTILIQSKACEQQQMCQEVLMYNLLYNAFEALHKRVGH